MFQQMPGKATMHKKLLRRVSNCLTRDQVSLTNAGVLDHGNTSEAAIVPHSPTNEQTNQSFPQSYMYNTQLLPSLSSRTGQQGRNPHGNRRTPLQPRFGNCGSLQQFSGDARSGGCHQHKIQRNNTKMCQPRSRSHIKQCERCKHAIDLTKDAPRRALVAKYSQGLKSSP